MVFHWKLYAIVYLISSSWRNTCVVFSLFLIEMLLLWKTLNIAVLYMCEYKIHFQSRIIGSKRKCILKTCLYCVTNSKQQTVGALRMGAVGGIVQIGLDLVWASSLPCHVAFGKSLGPSWSLSVLLCKNWRPVSISIGWSQNQMR